MSLYKFLCALKCALWCKLSVSIFIALSATVVSPLCWANFCSLYDDENKSCVYDFMESGDYGECETWSGTPSCVFMRSCPATFWWLFDGTYGPSVGDGFEFDGDDNGQINWTTDKQPSHIFTLDNAQGTIYLGNDSYGKTVKPIGIWIAGDAATLQHPILMLSSGSTFEPSKVYIGAPGNNGELVVHDATLTAGNIYVCLSRPTNEYYYILDEFPAENPGSFPAESCYLTLVGNSVVDDAIEIESNGKLRVTQAGTVAVVNGTVTGRTGSRIEVKHGTLTLEYVKSIDEVRVEGATARLQFNDHIELGSSTLLNQGTIVAPRSGSFESLRLRAGTLSIVDNTTVARNYIGGSGTIDLEGDNTGGGLRSLRADAGGILRPSNLLFATVTMSGGWIIEEDGVLRLGPNRSSAVPHGSVTVETKDTLTGKLWIEDLLRLAPGSTVAVEAAAQIRVGNVEIGTAEQTTTASSLNVNGRLSIDGNVYIGKSSSGLLHVTSGGFLDSGFKIYVGNESVPGTLRLDGQSQTTFNSVVIGDQGTLKLALVSTSNYSSVKARGPIVHLDGVLDATLGGTSVSMSIGQKVVLIDVPYGTIDGQFDSFTLPTPGSNRHWHIKISNQQFVLEMASGSGAIVISDERSVRPNIAAGYWQSAITDHGNVVSWGSAPAIPIPGISQSKSVAVGRYHGLSLQHDGSVQGWGDNSALQLTMPTGLDSIEAVAAGLLHSLLLKADGDVIGLGGTISGEGLGAVNLRWVSAIAAGDHHSLALIGGQVVAFGDNSVGQGTIPNALADTYAVKIAAGFEHSLAIAEDGTVYAWGDNSYGQCAVPAQLSEVSTAHVVEVAAGFYHSMALQADGTVWIWGEHPDIAGALALPTTLINNPTDPNDDVVGIAAGAFHALAVRRDRSMVGWGQEWGRPVPRLRGLFYQQAHDLGAQWKCSGGGACDDTTWRSSGDTIPFPLDATLSVTYKDIPGYTTPAPVTGITFATWPTRTGTLVKVAASHAIYDVKYWNVTPVSAQPWGRIEPASSISVVEGDTVQFALFSPGATVTMLGCPGSIDTSQKPWMFTSAPISADCSVEFVFSEPSYNFSATATLFSGEVVAGSVTPAAAVLGYNSRQPFTVAPPVGYETPDIINGNTCYAERLSGNSYLTTTLSADCQLRVQYNLARYVVTINSGLGGTINPASVIPVLHNSTKSFVLQADDNHSIATVSGCGGVLSAYDSQFPIDRVAWFITAPITAPCSIDVAFVPREHTVQARISGAVSASVSPNSYHNVIHGSSALPFTITTAEATTLRSAYGCSGSIVQQDATTYIYTTGEIGNDCVVSVEFAAPTHHVSVVLDETTNAASGSATCFYMGFHYSPWTLTADLDPAMPLNCYFNPDNYSTLESVTDDCGSIGAGNAGTAGTLVADNYTIATLTHDCTVRATFGLERFAVNVVEAGEIHGQATPLGLQQVSYLDRAKLSITADEGYRVTTIDTGCNYSQQSANTDPIWSDCTITVYYNRIEFNVDTDTPTPLHGYIEPYGSLRVGYGDRKAMVMTPDSGYDIGDVRGCGGELVGDTFTTAPIYQDCTVSMSFTPGTWTVSTQADHGSMNPAQVDIGCEQDGASLWCGFTSIAVIADEHYSIDDVSGCGYGYFDRTHGIYDTGNVYEDCTVTATFVPDRFEVLANAGTLAGNYANGGVEPIVQQAPFQGVATLALTPDPGYQVERVISDCDGHLSANSYVIDPVLGPCEVQVLFVPESGRLLVTSALPGAQISGAQWRADGELHWRHMGALLPLESGLRSISFKEVAGYNTPPDQSILIETDGTSTLVADYQLQVPDLLGGGHIVAGGHHNIVLKRDGHVLTWLEDPSHDFAQTDLPDDISDVRAIAVGDHHSILLKGDGTVLSFGGLPESGMEVPSGLSDVVAIAAGSNHSLALRSDGTMVGWGGEANFGQPGRVPDELGDPLLAKIVAIDATATQSLALRSDGKLLTWGGDDVAGLLWTTPDMFSADWSAQKILQVAGNGQRVIAQLANGRWVMWSANWKQTSITYLDVNDFASVTSIAMSKNALIALHNDATVHGLYGFGDECLDLLAIPEPLLNPTSAHVAQLSVANGYALALRRDGTVVSWGQAQADSSYYGTGACEAQGSALLHTPTLSASISPPDAVEAGAQWRCSGGGTCDRNTWHNSQDVVPVSINGTYDMQFSEVPGYSAPSDVASLAPGTLVQCSVEDARAQYQRHSFSVAVTATGQGTVQPSTLQVIPYLSSASFTINAATGYAAQISGDCGLGTWLDESTFATETIRNDCTVHVDFSPRVYSVTPVVRGAGSVTPFATQLVLHGNDVSFELQPSAGWAVSASSECAPTAFATSAITYIVHSVASDCSINIVFSNQAPAIVGLHDVVMQQDTTTEQLVIVVDDVTPPAQLILEPSSSNTALLPNANVLISTNIEGVPMLSISPVAGAYGVSTISISASDGSNTTTESFLLSVQVPSCIGVADGAPCDDDNSCTQADVCNADVCVGTAASCDDGNPCTSDGCEAARGCIYTFNTNACDDGNPCTKEDSCNQGACTSWIAVEAGTPCTDDLMCTYADQCDGIGRCIGESVLCRRGSDCDEYRCCGELALDCDDDNACTTDWCDDETGCAHAPLPDCLEDAGMSDADVDDAETRRDIDTADDGVAGDGGTLDVMDANADDRQLGDITYHDISGDDVGITDTTQAERDSRQDATSVPDGSRTDIGDDDKGGCGCHVAMTSTRSEWVVIVLAVLYRRRRRRQHA